MRGVLITTRAALVVGGLIACLAPAAQAAMPASVEQTAQQVCDNCHGRQGESAGPAFPHLAGQNAAYITKQLRDFKSGRRDNRAMREMMAELSDAELIEFGVLYAAMKPVPHTMADAAPARAGRLLFNAGKPKLGVPACTACHGAQASGSNSLPRLAGQHALYLKRQLQDFGQRQRTNDNAVMHDIASRLSEPEMDAVASYLSGLK